MVIRRLYVILPGTEITLPYFAGMTWISREKDLTGIIEGPCHCVMCVSERCRGALRSGTASFSCKRKML